MYNLTIELKGQNKEALLQGVEYARKQLEAGFTSGSLDNEDNMGEFNLSVIELK